MGCSIILRRVYYGFRWLAVVISLVVICADLIRGLSHIVHISATIGETVKLQCHTSLSTPVLWLAIWKETGSEDILTFVGNIYNKFNGWFTLDKATKGDFNLIIHSIQLRHAGQYICQEDGGFGPAEFTFVLEVLVVTTGSVLPVLGTRSRTLTYLPVTTTVVVADVSEQTEQQRVAEKLSRNEGSKNYVTWLKIGGSAVGLMLLVMAVIVVVKVCIGKRNVSTKRHSDEEIALNEHQECDNASRIKRIDPADINRDVWGLTMMRDRLYVAWRSTPTIKAFKATSPYDYLNHNDIVVEGLSVPSGLEGCESSMCLYLADSSNGCVWEFPYADTSKATKWYELGNCEKFVRMTLTNDGSVILLMRKETDTTGLHWTGILRILNANGTAQQPFELALPKNVVNPWHAFPLENNMFIVAYGPADLTASHGVMKLQVSKRRLTTVSDCKTGKLNVPIDTTRCEGAKGIYVADSCNGRILLLDEKLKLRSTVIRFECDTGGVELPTRVRYESRTKTMFVGFASGHVDIFSLRSDLVARKLYRY